MTDAAATPPDATPITAQSIEDKLAAGAPIEAADVRWLLDTLRSATASTDARDSADTADTAHTAGHTAVAGGMRRPTREELVAEFRLGPDPSPDMLAYLADYVVEREAEAAVDAAEAADGS